MEQQWRFHGREAEMAQLRAAFLAPGFDLIALPGRRVVGKSWLLQEAVRSLPQDRPAFLFRANPWESPEGLLGDLKEALLHARKKRPGIGRPLDSDGNPLRALPQVLESLLRRGVSVAIDDAHYLLSDKLPGLVLEIAAMARRLRQEAHGAGSGLLVGGRRGALVLAGWDHFRMRDLLAALGPAVTVFMPLDPWPAATLLAIARDRGWLDRPHRLALARAVYGGMPMDWERFSSDRIADFAAWPDDGKWRRAFADRIVERVTAWGDPGGRAAHVSEEDLRILEHVARSPDGEAGARALGAAFPDMAPDRLEARLKELRDKRLRLETVPAFPGPSADSGDTRNESGQAGGGAPEERWRIYDPEFRFWVDAGMPRIFNETIRLHSPPHSATPRLAGRMEAMEKDALAQFRRDCGDDWTEPVKRGRLRIRGNSRSPDPEVERHAFAFDVTAPGVLEGVLVPYGVPIRIGDAPGSGGKGFDEVFEPGSLMVNGLLVNVRQPGPQDRGPGQALPPGRPLARPGQGLELHDGPDAMRATVTLPDTIDGRRVRALVEAGELTAFSAAFQVLEEEWTAPPAPDSDPEARRIVRRARLVGLALADRPEQESLLIDGIPMRPGAC